MPMFQWHADDETGTVSSNIWLYWVVTIPLTLITILTWTFWMRYRVKEKVVPVKEMANQDKYEIHSLNTSQTRPEKSQSNTLLKFSSIDHILGVGARQTHDIIIKSFLLIINVLETAGIGLLRAEYQVHCHHVLITEPQLLSSGYRSAGAVRQWLSLLKC